MSAWSPATNQTRRPRSRRRRGSKSSGLVFGTRRWDHFRSAWENAVERPKLADFHFHDLRHTFASWAVQRGASLQEVKDLLGHNSLAMTLRYGHLAPEHLPHCSRPARCGPAHQSFSARFSARARHRGRTALEVAVVAGAPGRSRTCDPRIRSSPSGRVQGSLSQVVTSISRLDGGVPECTAVRCGASAW
jgi:Phage integrase family